MNKIQFVFFINQVQANWNFCSVYIIYTVSDVFNYAAAAPIQTLIYIILYIY